MSEQEQQRLVDACLDALHPDTVPARFGAPDEPGERHRWDIGIGMAVQSFDSGDSGLERYLTWGQKSEHKNDDERTQAWAGFNGDGKVTVGTLLSFGREAGVTMPWTGHNGGVQEQLRALIMPSTVAGGVHLNSAPANHDLDHALTRPGQQASAHFDTTTRTRVDLTCTSSC